MFFHAIKDVKELKQAIETANDLDFEESFFIEFFIRLAVEVFCCFIDDVNELLKI